MRCPICKIPSFRPVGSADVEVDRCGTCGALWFDTGELRELTTGRLDPLIDGEEAGRSAGSPPEAEAGGKPGAVPGRLSRIARMHRLATGERCPRCGTGLVAVDFQATGIPAIACRSCGGMLVPGESATQIAERFRFSRKHAELYAAMGESIARSMKKALDLKYLGEREGAERVEIPKVALPVVVPLATDAPPPRTFPMVSWIFFALPVVLFLFATATGSSCRLPTQAGGLPAGGGLGGGTVPALLLYAFLPGGVLPLATGLLFLLLMGRPVEDRMGGGAFAALYLGGAWMAGAVHLLAGKAGAPPALGPAGPVSAVLGAYLVFFPNVPVRMYGMGRVESVPAYLFACCWLVATFLYGSGGGGIFHFLDGFLNHAPLSFAGHLGGFLAGGAGAALLRAREEGRW